MDSTFISIQDLLVGQQAGISTNLLEMSAWKPLGTFASIQKPPLSPQQRWGLIHLPSYPPLRVHQLALRFIYVHIAPRDCERPGGRGHISTISACS